MRDLTVVMPLNKPNSLIFDSIESVFYKSYLKIKLILIYNNIDVRFLSKLEGFCKNFEDVVIVKAQNKGLAMSLAQAVLMAETKYIARIDSDDLVVKGRFEKQIAFLDKNEKVAVVGSQIQFINHEGEVRGYSSYPTSSAEVREKFAYGSQVAHPSVMFKKLCVIAVGNYQDFELDEGTSITEDLFLWLRILDKYEIANLPDVLTKYRQHDGQTSSNHKLKIEEATLRLVSLKIISQVINKELRITYEEYPIYRKSDPLLIYTTVKKSGNTNFCFWIKKVRVFYAHAFLDKIINFRFWESFLVMKKLLLFNYFHVTNQYKEMRF